MTPRVLVHFRTKGAWRNGRSGDVVLDQAQRHPACQVNQARLAGGAGVGLLRIDRDAVDRCDVDDLGHCSLAGLAQMSMQSLRQEKRRLQVQIDHLVPTAFREIIELGTPGGPGIVDQNVELVFPRRIRVHQRLRSGKRCSPKSWTTALRSQ